MVLILIFRVCVVNLNDVVAVIPAAFTLTLFIPYSYVLAVLCTNQPNSTRFLPPLLGK
jgi:hypothetical protein